MHYTILNQAKFQTLTVYPSVTTNLFVRLSPCIFRKPLTLYPKATHSLRIHYGLTLQFFRNQRSYAMWQLSSHSFFLTWTSKYSQKSLLIFPYIPHFTHADQVGFIPPTRGAGQYHKGNGSDLFCPIRGPVTYSSIHRCREGLQLGELVVPACPHVLCWHGCSPSTPAL